MIVEDDKLGTSQITFAQLSERTSRFAQILRNFGVGPGERILIRLPNSLDYPTAFLGAMKCGAISVPTSTLLTGEEVVYLAQDSGAAVLVTDKAAWTTLKDQLHDAVNLRHVLLSGPGEVQKVEGLGCAGSGIGLVRNSEMRAAVSDEIDRSGVSGLHLRHHRLPQGCFARAPRHDRPHPGVHLLV